MMRSLLLQVLLLLSVNCLADNIIVKDITELNKANASAKPGDVIVLQNGIWNNVVIKLNCSGTAAQPIIFKAQTAGKVFISGNSKLKIGGTYITVEGLYFANGYAGDDAVIDFRTSKKEVANNCRVTNCVINDFNNLLRMDENYWISFYGKNNRLDHCSFLNKKNMGVLLAVILDDERSRENFHSIDHNYFGVRLPLASNGGEIIRVGVSQHCEFNSNTQIVDNFFEHCDGETEIVSIKSGSNVVRNNLFKECQGSVVLRHGNFNTVENNIFLGNGKEGTGGVRIINKGQWVVNNLFYQCRGVSFRSPLSVMNGVPNSPAFRYVAVTDAVVINNSFYNCTPISLCEGSDTERSVAPLRVYFENNILYNDKGEKIYNAYDDISGFNFRSNIVSTSTSQQLPKGFIKTNIDKVLADKITIPATVVKNKIDDSLQTVAKERIAGKLSSSPGFMDLSKYQLVKQNAYNNCGAAWFTDKNITYRKENKVICKTPADIIAQLAKDNHIPTTLVLTGSEYKFSEPLLITGNITLTSNKKPVNFSSTATLLHLFQIKGGGAFNLNNINLNLSGLSAGYFITADVGGSSGHSNFSMNNTVINSFEGSFFNAAKSTMFDNIIVKNSSFSGIKNTLFNFANETDKKGYYNVEKLKITYCTFTGNGGQLLTMLRGGNDESTLGPLLVFSNNTITGNNTSDALIKLNGTQRSIIENNKFKNSNTNNTLLQFEDAVRAVHTYRNNTITYSGKVITNKFVEAQNNTIN